MQDVINGYVNANQDDKEKIKDIIKQLHKMETETLLKLNGLIGELNTKMKALVDEIWEIKQKMNGK